MGGRSRVFYSQLFSGVLSVSLFLILKQHSSSCSLPAYLVVERMHTILDLRITRCSLNAVLVLDLTW